MNRRRELVLQRVSRIGSLAAAENTARNAMFRGRPTGMLTIEAAIGTYMTKDGGAYDPRRRQDSYIRTSMDSNKQEQEQLSRQMTEYLSTLEEGQLANRHSARQLNTERIKKALANDPSARYQLGRYAKKDDAEEQTAFDRLDANRCSGFLLYSYNKKGVHSVLGEHITPGSEQER